MSEQTGKRCRKAARNDCRVRGYHGVTRFDRIKPKIAGRVVRGVAIGGAGIALEAALSGHLLHPKTLAIFRKRFANRVPLHLHAALLIELDANVSRFTSATS